MTAPKWIKEYKCDGQGGFSPKLGKKKTTHTHTSMCVYTPTSCFTLVFKNP